MVKRLLLSSLLRHLGRHRWQAALSILGIALGVTMIVAVDLANQSARQAFLLSAESLTGRATHQISGGPAGVPETVYRRLRMEFGLRDSAPVVSGLVRHNGETLQLLGVDPLAERPFRQHGTAKDSGFGGQLLGEPDSVLLSPFTADRLGVGLNDEFEISAGGHFAKLRVAGLLQGDNPAVLEGILLADISTAQEVLQQYGRLDRIDLILTPRQVQTLTAWLPPGLRLEVPASRTRVMLEMIEAFQTNLSAMSLLAILVGAFLIYNTMTFAVLRRRQLLASLRLLGVTRRTLFALILLEAALLGLTGILLGLLLGSMTAHYLVQLVTRTINDLYFVLTVTQLLVSPMLLLKGAVIGLGVTLLAALGPALEAARTRPAAAMRGSLLEQRVRRGLPAASVLGLALLLCGLYLVPDERLGLTGGFVALFLIIGGYSLLVPLLVSLLGWIGTRLVPSGAVLTAYALRGIQASLSRTGLAVAALSLAVAATLGVGIMITSFRATVADWLAYTLRGDVYVSSYSSQIDGSGQGLPAGSRATLRALDSVEETSTGRRVRVETTHGPADLLALETASRSHKGFKFVEPPLPELWDRFRHGQLILVSEPYAHHHRIRTGEQLQLFTPAGEKNWIVGGVFYDYGSDQGLLSMHQTQYARLWNDDSYNTIGVFLRPGVDSASAIEQIRQALVTPNAELRIRSSRDIREYSMAVFDRTFAITQVLRLLAVGVAFVGVLSTLLALQLERAREHAVVRASGATPAQLTRLVLLQTGLLGCYAGLLALPLGWLMSEVLIEVINRRSFGWSIATQFSPTLFLQALLLAVAAALLAGAYPAWRMGRARLALALRAE